MPTSQAEPVEGTAPSSSAPAQHANGEPIVVAAKVRPLTVAPPTGEMGYPLPSRDALAALSLDSPGARRHTVRCVKDRVLPIAHVSLPLPLPIRWALLGCRHARLGAGCVPSMQTLPDEIWERIFGYAVERLDVPNAIEFGDPPRPVDSPRGRFHCGLALDADVPQPVMYETLMVPLVKSALDGFSAAFITFGPRGSGKTHTLEGCSHGANGREASNGAANVAGEASSGDVAVADEGMMRKALRHVLLELHRRHGGPWSTTHDFARFSCYAVHKRIVYDMLAPDGPSQRKVVRTDASGGRVHGFVEGLHAPPVSSAAECDALLEASRAARHRLPVCPACANWTRELDVFWTLHVREGPLTGGSLSFVKLAGHDRRQRCNECRPLPGGSGREIAQTHGMSSLSLVLSTLADGKAKYVPYRDSPTTELMQEMLGGRARVAWLAHVTPGPEGDFDETVATLRLAVLVGKIRNAPERLPHSLAVAERAAEAREIEELQGLLRSGPRPSSRRMPGTPSGPSLAQRAVKGVVKPGTPPDIT
mmetsp:Transcript_37685/g.99595  ORF Transcript_37685/g.99595 Transcript_37685/m.99595 type:complete len:535 (+) Transcript_37685:64-1668(+)